MEADVKVEECDLAGGKAIISKAPDQRQKRPGEDVAPLPYDAPPRQKRVKWVEEDGKEQDEGEGEERLWKFVRHAHAFIAKKASDGRAPSAVLGLGADVEGQLNEDNAKDTGDEESIAAKDNPKLVGHGFGDCCTSSFVPAFLPGLIFLSPAGVAAGSPGGH